MVHREWVKVETNRQTDGEAETDRQTDRQTDRRKDRGKTETAKDRANRRTRRQRIKPSFEAPLRAASATKQNPQMNVSVLSYG